MTAIRSGVRALRTALFVQALAWIPAPPASTGQTSEDIVRVPVSFAVINQNTSDMQVRCPSEGRPYTVRGHIVGPRLALEGPQPRAITHYLHGFDTGWHHPFPIEGYDWGIEMARLGHVSLMIDMLGYDTSDHPPGGQMCLGSQADVSHQIIQQLRSGDYSLAGGSDNGIPFSQVLLGGHDVAGGMVELEAHSFQDIDGLIVMNWSDQGVDLVYLSEFIVKSNATCIQGGEHYETGEPGGGYVFFGPPDERYQEELFVDADPSVLDAVVALRNRNPCGYLGSIIPTMETNTLRNREITVPVLLLYTDGDPVVPEQSGVLQEELFAGSSDVTRETQLGSGHFPWFERSAAEYRGRVSHWLCSRGFASAAVACGSTSGKATGGGRIDVATGEPELDPVSGEVLELATMVIQSGADESSAPGGGRASFGFVAKLGDGDAAPSGNLRYHDHGADLELKATSITAFAIAGGSCGPDSHATLRGQALVDATSDQDFVVEVDDCGEAGSSDGFALRVTGPDVSYSAAGVVIGGNIQVSR